MLESQEQPPPPPPPPPQQQKLVCDIQYVECATRRGHLPNGQTNETEVRTSTTTKEVEGPTKRSLPEEEDEEEEDDVDNGDQDDESRRGSHDSQKKVNEVGEDESGRAEPSNNLELRNQMIESSRQTRSSQMNNNSPAPLDRRADNDNNNNNVKVDAESERRYRPQKYCAVCGDKAIACNFNAVTCESCKAFFRRNAFKEMQLKCLFEKKCVIDRVTRRFCSKCRLLKCFEIGMKREWILTDEQKHIKRIKILQNKQSRRNGVCTPDGPTPGEHQSDKSFDEETSTTITTAEQMATDKGQSSANDINITTTEYANSIEQDQSSDQVQSDVSEAAEERRKKIPTMARTARQQMPFNAKRQSRRVETKDAATCCPDESDLLPSGQHHHFCTLANQCQFCAAFMSTTGPPMDVYSNGPTQVNHNLQHHHHQQTPTATLNYLPANQSQPMLTPHQHQHQHQQLQSNHQHHHPHQQQFSPHQPQAAHLMPNHHHHHHHYVPSGAPHAAGPPPPPPPANQAPLDQSMSNFYATNGQPQTPMNSRHHQQLQPALSTPTPATCCCMNSTQLQPPHASAYPPILAVPVLGNSSHHLVQAAPPPPPPASGQLVDSPHAYPPQLHLLRPAQSAVNLSGVEQLAIGSTNQVAPPAVDYNAADKLSSPCREQQQATAPPGNCNPFVMALEAHSIWDSTSSSSHSNNCNSVVDAGGGGQDVDNHMHPNDNHDDDESLISNSTDDIRKTSSVDTMQQYRINQQMMSRSTIQPSPPSAQLALADQPRQTPADSGNEPVGSSTSAAASGHNHQPIPTSQVTRDSQANRQAADHVVWDGELFSAPANDEAQLKQRVERLNYGDSEKQLILEMIEATRFLFEPRDASNSSDPRLLGVPNTLDDFVYFCDAALRKLIKSVKQIKAFRILSMDDQIMLLKTACFKVLLLRSTFHFKEEIEGWQDSKTGKTMRLDILKGSKKSFVYQRHSDMIKKISEPLRRDRMIMSIMCMALLFDPNINLKHSNSVGLDNLIYLSIMRKYLVETQPDPLAKYERLVGALQDVNACNDEYNAFFSKDFQPEQMTPLLIEIFDISINNSM